VTEQQPGVAAAAFAAHEAIRSGAWDDHLPALWLAVRDRQRVLAQAVLAEEGLLDLQNGD
jgi:hypothetical protein